MPKQKSSATLIMRNKHARKAVNPIADPPPQRGQKQTGKKGDNKEEPQVKVYIPPVKPQPIAPDPPDALGLAYAPPAELAFIC
ncbi:hypothetical protein FIBSPDRAFT_864843 [Athelia psychrophila]|uniref:Uncharacterized protein n=1 Tax=Athelia psychrophila TaxID=1759441 RepID=A0A166G3Y8_9AGAM|nr:hypothetical protein FIBSPDRAFT_864843 [Fibularhizoctonia sp. CBS 109695]